MLNMGGELVYVIQDIDFKDKKDLLDILRAKRKELVNSTIKDKEIIFNMLTVAIQQVFYLNDFELNRYKKYLNETKKENDK